MLACATKIRSSRPCTIRSNKSTRAAIIPGFSQIVIQVSKPEEKLELQRDTRLTVSFPGFAFVTLK